MRSAIDSIGVNLAASSLRVNAGYDAVPEDIRRAFDDGERFDNPNPPYYYQADAEEE